ncbi:rod-binding protein [Thiomicrorhabdus sp. Milos-T2]|uniref:rod-binding protein n=1 Tax=Thiomicrorhabdus sp. Milos-T2 TaxID=90814 RepID=UPI00069220AC|nr:rod-binding protein [Thiomicrorhabdus sp. Milos-T2]
MNINNRIDTLINQNKASNAAQNYTDLQGLNSLREQAREDQRAALKPVAEQFEAIFVQQIFKESRKVSFDDGWLDGNQGDFYKDWHDKQLAQDLAAKGTLGFADTIVEQLLPSIPAVKKLDNQTSDLVESGSQKPVETKNNNQPSTEDALALRFAK